MGVAVLHQGLTKHVYVPERMRKSMSEIADDVEWRNCLNHEAQTGGVLFARKDDNGAKEIARARVVASLASFIWPGNLRILTLPGLKWEFERRLMQVRQRWCTRTTILALERDPAIYFASIKWMPRRFHYTKPFKIGNGQITQVSPHCLRTRSIHSYYFTSAESFVNDPHCPEVDAAWFDFTGTINTDTMAALRRFWREYCTWQMTITALNGRYRADTAKLVKRHGGFVEWILHALPGSVADVHRYQDGRSAMVQVTLQKDLTIPAEEWMNG